MKKLMVSLFMISLLPAGWMVGCTGNKPPLSPGLASGAAPVATVVPTATLPPASLYEFEPEPTETPAPLPD